MNIALSSPCVWTHFLTIIPLFLLCFTRYVIFVPVFVLSLIMSGLYHYYKEKKQYNLEKKFLAYDIILAWMGLFIVLYIFMVSPKTPYSLIGAVFIVFAIVFPKFMLCFFKSNGYTFFHSIWHLFMIYGFILILFSLIKNKNS